MKAEISKNMAEIYRHCRSCLNPEMWDEMIRAMHGGEDLDTFPALLSTRTAQGGLAPYLPDLARLERSIHRAEETVCSFAAPDNACVNPSLELVPLSWKNLLDFMRSGADPEEGPEFVIAFRHPKTAQLINRVATSDDLLALKLVAEGVSCKDAARQTKVSVAKVDSVLDRAVREGLLISPPSKIRRDPHDFPLNEGIDEAFISAQVFTLQWHITQTCDLHCKHCYDRTDRHPMKLSQALKILEGFYDFCKSRNVRGQVSFTGGNPLLYPHFMELYRAASDFGFTIALLGNPAPRTKIERIVAIEPPAFYQVSLEGLQRHNDDVRGPGHYDRVMTFLDVLRDFRIYSMVMLTLTRDNIEEVIPLAERLSEKADLFTFNRLSMVGEGAKLQLPSKDRYAAFLKEYVEASKQIPVIAFKDNLINILLHERGTDLFGGCAGYGCGAAFNFIAVLPDGEAHACRKFPSPIGNVLEQGIAAVYDSAAARRYRSGCADCKRCPIRPVCGGCLAVSHGLGFNVFEERDPFCFKS